MAISKRMRHEVMRRDSFTCRYCGVMSNEAVLTIDHVMPRALGGGDEPSNLVTACADCNSGKSSSAPSAAFVAEVNEADMRLAAALRQAAAEMLAGETPPDPADPAELYADAFDGAWIRWRRTGSVDVDPSAFRPKNWRTTVKSFHGQGLPLELALDAIEIAMARTSVWDDHKFRYTCGICWNRIRQLQDRAAQIIREQGYADGDLNPAGSIAESS